ncbi:NADH-quinone oxidoreductase subunit D [Pleomorphochaeta sp. DL1XJH-081]|uniref:NADH-quinone oxidoreductase subunit D n=1 Tax=Pleomorphochaeta sp. DL1XJH-081 TaxID=3409690 RepID=UPI003BB5A216
MVEMLTHDPRGKFPPVNAEDGKSRYDLHSGKYLKIWQGPQHPGITGNMSLELTVCGDEVIECKTHVGYLHRGFEKLMERRRYIQCFPLVCRICVPEPDFNEYLFAECTEELAGIEVPEKAIWYRTLTLEMARLASFLMWIGGQAGAFGMATIGQWTVTMRDYVLDLFEELSGGRIYHMYIIPGGVRSDLPSGFALRVEKTLEQIEKVLDDVELVMMHNAVFKKRAKGLGIITPSIVDEYGITGPNARGSGITRDIRKDTPYLVYDKLDFTVVTEEGGDAYARTWVRLRETRQSIDLIRQIVSGMPTSGPFFQRLPNVLHWKIPAGQTYRRAECTRGEYGFFMVSDGSELPRRVYVRGPSYTHAVTLMEKLAVHVNIADTAGLMVSLHTYPPEIER